MQASDYAIIICFMKSPAICVTSWRRSKFVAFAFVQGLDPKLSKNWTKVRFHSIFLQIVKTAKNQSFTLN